jgi:predicted dehydrogenase
MPDSFSRSVTSINRDSTAANRFAGGPTAQNGGVASDPRRRFEQRIALSPRPIRTAVIGYGYWGPNLARNLGERPELDLALLCDRDDGQRALFTRRFPHVGATAHLEEALGDPSVDAVVIATPPNTHYAIAKAALEAGKHVLVEKPLATNLADACELAAIARREGCVLMPGHTFVYSPPVNAVRDLIQSGEVGDVHFVTSSRMNLGKYTVDGVVCDLAPHDLSILLYWLEQPVVRVAASGSSVLCEGVAETAFLTFTFERGQTANVQISWLAPRKLRQMIVVGSKRMVQYDDTASDEPVRVYDRGMDMLPDAPANFGEHQLIYRTGDVVIPRVAPAEPLSLELQDFAKAIHTGEEPRSNVGLGLEIVAAMESAEASMRDHGAPQPVAALSERLQAA